MCCFVALRKVLLFMAFIHMGLGVLFIDYLVTLIQWLLIARHEDDMTLGLLFMAYYCFSIPLGFVIFWGTYKRSRPLLRWSAMIFLVLEVCVFSIHTYYYFSFVSWSYLMLRRVSTKSLIQTLPAISYLLAIYFYLRELEPEEDPWAIPSGNHLQVAYHPTQQQPIPISNIQSHPDLMMNC